MRGTVFGSLLCSLLLVLAGCGKHATTQSVTDATQEFGQAKFDACGLIEKEEIEAIQESPIKETKSSARSDAGFRVSQCFYTAAEFSKSVSLAVTQRDLSQPTGRSVKAFWEETFGRYDDEKKESDQGRSEEERKESIPPKRIDGIGEDAFWSRNRVGGALYVLKKDTFIRISVGGPDSEESRIDKSKALAAKALSRL